MVNFPQNRRGEFSGEMAPSPLAFPVSGPRFQAGIHPQEPAGDRGEEGPRAIFVARIYPGLPFTYRFSYDQIYPGCLFPMLTGCS